jgi:hypothetical protein
MDFEFKRSPAATVRMRHSHRKFDNRFRHWINALVPSKKVLEWAFHKFGINCAWGNSPTHSWRRIAFDFRLLIFVVWITLPDAGFNDDTQVLNERSWLNQWSLGLRLNEIRIRVCPCRYVGCLDDHFESESKWWYELQHWYVNERFYNWATPVVPILYCVIVLLSVVHFFDKFSKFKEVRPVISLTFHMTGDQQQTLKSKISGTRESIWSECELWLSARADYGDSAKSRVYASRFRGGYFLLLFPLHLCDIPKPHDQTLLQHELHISKIR